MRRRLIYVLAGFLLLIGLAALVFELNNGFKKLHLHSAYVRQGANYQKGMIDAYRSDGPYFNYGVWARTADSGRPMSDGGLPLVNYDGVLHLNAVTLAEFGLAEYERFQNGRRSREDVIRVADGLRGIQSDNGAFRYGFRWRHYLNDAAYEPGWISGMAQGQALSLFSRAYRLTGDMAYVTAGSRALDFLTVPIADGGPMGTLADIDPDWAEHIFFEEYILEPQAYTLNGFIYVLIGLYDWAQLPEVAISTEEQARARDLFKRGVTSLELLLPLYDPDRFTVYDLGYITHKRKPHFSSRYHATHTYQLHTLAGITDSAIIRDTAERWKSYVDPETSLFHRVATWRYK